MNTNQLLIIGFAILYFSYIIYTRRRADFESFSVANRNLGTFMIFATVVASYIHPNGSNLVAP
ncbi:MAG: hypothetical protein AAGI23_18685 [Bacteroidota bacterium]